jgi:hypothetical protein
MTGSCPVHAPWPEGESPEEKLKQQVKIRDEALRIVTGGDSELVSSLIVQARENLGDFTYEFAGHVTEHDPDFSQQLRG